MPAGQRHLDPGVRHEAVIAFEATDSNPNGDPDAGNQPRIDPESGHGLVTDVSLKRKIRDTVALLHGADDRYGIFVTRGVALSPRANEGWTTTSPPRTSDAGVGAGVEGARPGADTAAATAWLCHRYFDVRMFGAVLTRGKGKPAVQVRGPVQVSMARSLDPVFTTRHAITRVTQSRQADVDKGETTELGARWAVEYGLYVAHLYYSPLLAARTGVTGADLDALWRSIVMMFDLTRSTSRAGVDLAGLWVFSHPDPYGIAPARILLDSIRITPTATPPRRLQDYDRALPTPPDRITLTTLHDRWEPR